MNAVQMLDRILDPVTAIFTPEAARRLVDLPPDPVFQARLDELASKSNQGELSDSELREYEVYVNVVEVVSLFQAKARRLLEPSTTHG